MALRTIREYGDNVLASRCKEVKDIMYNKMINKKLIKNIEDEYMLQSKIKKQ